MIKELKYLSYEARLKHLGLLGEKVRYIKGDLIEV